MFPLVLGISTAFTAALMHAACIRIVKPRSKFLSLLVLEALALTMGATLLARSDAGASDWVAGVVLSLSLTGGYLATFVGVMPLELALYERIQKTCELVPVATQKFYAVVNTSHCRHE